MSRDPASDATRAALRGEKRDGRRPGARREMAAERGYDQPAPAVADAVAGIVHVMRAGSREHPAGLRAFAAYRPEPVVVGRRAQAGDVHVGRIEAGGDQLIGFERHMSRTCVAAGILPAGTSDRGRFGEARDVERLADLGPTS